MMLSTLPIQRSILLSISVLFLWFGSAVAVQAATLTISPATGVYTVGQTFTVQVRLNSQGSTINAAEGSLSFNPTELSVLSVQKGSVFNLWTSDPTFSNSQGTIQFSGGTPGGYTGGAGQVLSITLQAKTAGAPRLRFADGAVLAADGRGTNILSTMNGGSFTVSAPSTSPEPETIEYVAPANTPAAPVVSSDTHPDPSGWSTETIAELQWSVPADVTALRTLLDTSANTIPTKLYESPINSITIEDLEEGQQYFHVQFQNADGWGAVTHYRLGVDTTPPEGFTIRLADDVAATNPEPVLQVESDESGSGVVRYIVKVNDSEPFTYEDEEGSGRVPLPRLDPGYHLISIEAFDAAGNSTIQTFSHTIEAFTAPHFIELPDTVSASVIPVLRGETVPNADVKVAIKQLGSDPVIYTVQSDDAGLFTVIPDNRFQNGVYEITAQATDATGAVSDISTPRRLAVQEPNVVRIGSLVLSVMSVIVPLLALLIICIVGFVYLIARVRSWRSSVGKEAEEAAATALREFATLNRILQEQTDKVKQTRKSKTLTKAEAALVETMETKLHEAKQNIQKEVADIEESIE